MILLEVGGILFGLMVILFIPFWVTPIYLLVRGLGMIKSNPKKAKKFLIISGIWLLVGMGTCGGVW